MPNDRGVAWHDRHFLFVFSAANYSVHLISSVLTDIVPTKIRILALQVVSLKISSVVFF